MINGEILIC